MKQKIKNKGKSFVEWLKYGDKEIGHLYRVALPVQEESSVV